MKDFKQIADQVQLFIVTREHTVEWPMPTMPNVITVPPLGCVAPNALPAAFERIVTKAKHGVIIVSFGSIANYFRQETVEKLIAAFRSN